MNIVACIRLCSLVEHASVHNYVAFVKVTFEYKIGITQNF